MSKVVSERGIVLLVSAVHFVNLIDFLMVMPLGPDFSVALGIPVSKMGVVGGAYTAAAALAGLIGSLFLDRLDRKTALIGALAGLVFGTVLGGFATSFATMLASRAVAGMFAGPAASLAYSVFTDVVAPERRGKTFGAVLGAFALAQMVGVPGSLELARRTGWRTPFFVVAGMGVAAALTAWWLLPPMRGHLEKKPTPMRVWTQPTMILSLSLTMLFAIQAQLIIPNIAGYVQFNMGLPRSQLGIMYLTGGILSLISSRVSGPLVDRFGPVAIMTVGVVFTLVNYALWFVWPVQLIPAVVFFSGFAATQSIRLVSHNTLTSMVPLPNQRGRFLSLQMGVQHVAWSIGQFLSARMLVEAAPAAIGSAIVGEAIHSQKLVGMQNVAALAMVLTLSLTPLSWLIYRRVRQARPAQ